MCADNNVFAYNNTGLLVGRYIPERDKTNFL